jgi:hypothetical protein
MPRITGTTDAQSTFLRAFRHDPAGPAPADWPHPAVLRRWLRRPAFLTALNSLHQTLRFQIDFHLATAAARAAAAFTAQPQLTTQDFNRLLRLAHLRERFASTTQPNFASPATFKQRQEIRTLQASLEQIEEDRADRKTSGKKIDPIDQQFDEEFERETRDRLAQLKAIVKPTINHGPLTIDH